MAQIYNPEQIAARDALQPVLTTGEWRFEGDEIDNLRQGQRDHGKVDSLPPDRQTADQIAEQSGEESPSQNPQFRGQAAGLDQVAGDIRGAAKKSGMAEREQPGIAEQQVEGAGE